MSSFEQGQEYTRPAPPPILPLIANNLPLTDLGPYRQFVTWHLEWRDVKNGKPGRWTKPPVNPLTGKYAETNHPETWGALEDVLGQFDRIGFVVTKQCGMTILDCDDAIDVTGRIKPWAQAIVERCPFGYWEISPSGTGLKGIIRGTAPENRVIRIEDGKLEIFSSGKFTTLTGHRLPHSAATIGDGQAALDALIAELCAAPAPRPNTECCAPELDDRDIVARVARMAKGRRLHEEGDITGYASQSEAELALLACYRSAGAKDEDQADRLFRTSALMRDKWLHDDYRRRTLAKAFDGLVQPFPGWDQLGGPPFSGSVKTGASAGNPQDAGTGSSTPKLGVAPDTDELPDDISNLKQMVRDRTRLWKEAERRAEAAEQKAALLSQVQSTTARIIQNKALGQERLTAIALAYRFANLEAAGNTGDGGLHAITVGSIAEAAGVSDDAATKHVGKLVAAGALRKELRWFPRMVDPETGEITDGHQRQYIGPAGGSVTDFVESVATLRPEKSKNWGGKRVPRCPDHPVAGVIRRVTLHCSECDRELERIPDELLEAAGPDPQDAGHQSIPTVRPQESSSSVVT